MGYNKHEGDKEVLAMKKKLTAVLIAVCVLAMACMLTACYISRPDTEENVLGTYKLSVYTQVKQATDPENPDKDLEERTTDFIKTKGITAYFVVASKERGYYIYQDNDTALYAREVKLTFNYDEEETEKVEEITYTSGGDYHGDDYPGKGKESLGVNFSKSKKILSFYLPVWNGNLIKRDHSQQVTYEKVSDVADLSYVNEQLNVSLAVAPYETAKLDGIHVYDGYTDERCEYNYFIVDLKAAEKKADVYYLEKTAEEQTTLTNLPFTYTIEGDKMTIKLGDGITFTTYYSDAYPPAYIQKVIPATEENGTDEYFYFSIHGRTQTIPEIVAEIESAHRLVEETPEENGEE